MLWNLLVDGAEKSQLAEALLAEYEIDRETAEADVDRFVGVLRDAGALDD